MRKYSLIINLIICFILTAQAQNIPNRIIEQADLNMMRKEYNEGITKYLEAVELLISPDSIAELYDKIGYHFNTVDQNFEQAEYYFELGRLKRLKGKSVNMWRSYYNLGSLEFRRGNYEKSLASMRHITNLKNQNHIDKSTEALINFIIGLNYKSLFRKDNLKSKFDSSYLHLRSAWNYFDNFEHPYLETASYELTDLFILSENVDSASKYIEHFKVRENSIRQVELFKDYYHLKGEIDSLYKYSELTIQHLRNQLGENNISTVAEVTADYRTDKQLDQAEETAFLASQKAKTYGIVVIILLLVLAISYLIFLQTIQRKKLENLQAVVLGEEKERKRLAKDLHDGIGVLLTSIRMRLSSFEDKVDDQKAYHDSLEQIDDACSEVRRVSHNLSPASLEKLGLNEALHDLADQVNLSGNMRMVGQIKLPERLLSEEEEVLVYRIVQELINNSLKYAEANELTLSLKQEASDMKLHYRDNGKGFDKEIIKPGIGLKSIASRIDILKGKMSFQSQLGKGTEYEISIPING